MTILISRHATGEGPGYLAEFLDRHGLSYSVIKTDLGEPFPESIGHFSGLVFMGGPMSVNDELPWIPRALNLIRQAIDADVPVLGHCLGGQLISKALGATVGANPVREIGWYPVRAVATSATSRWFTGLPAEFEVYHWHGETFTIPAGATRLLTSDACANQAFAIGKTLALQCHVEMTASMVRQWSQLGAREIAQPSASIQSADAMAENLETRIECLHRIADCLYTAWVAGLRH